MLSIALIASVGIFLKTTINAANSTEVLLGITAGGITFDVSGSINLGNVPATFLDTTLTGTFSTGSFRVEDLSGSNFASTRYWKISANSMSGQTLGNTLTLPYFVVRPNNLNSPNQLNGDGSEISTSNNRYSLLWGQQQNLMSISSSNSGKIFRVSITPSISLTIPGGSPIDTYKTVLTVTVPWES